MPNFNDRLQQIAAARSATNQAEQSLYLKKLELQRLQHPDSYAAVKDALEHAQTVFDNARNNLDAAISGLYSEQPYRRLAENLDAGVPVLFLPVRVETRFVPQKTGFGQLWIRIYPDDVHVHTHEPLLTDQEVDAGRQYWRSLLAANSLEDPEAEKQRAWSVVTGFAGANRGLWVAIQTQPVNWSPDLAGEGSLLDFPLHDQTKTHTWTAAPRTQLMPDKFVVSIFRGDNLVHEQAGNTVPDTVYLGPDPFKAEEAFKKTGAQITLDDSFAWTTDFEDAVQKGLGMKIDLQPGFLNQNRIDRILVTGLLASSDPMDTKALVEQMIVNHHYARKGFSLTPQGTPTNNTERDSSGYTANEDLLEKGYFDGAGQAAQNPDSDAKKMTDALGISAGFVEGLQYSDMREEAEAKAMNAALYPATLGYFFEVLMKPIIKESAYADLRQFFTSLVTARGPLPAFRLGDQPYGLLVTSDLKTWTEPGATRDFYPVLANALKGLQEKWDELAANKAVYVGMNGDPGDVLLKVLGLQAGSVSFAQRLGSLPDYNYTLPNINLVNFQSEVVSKQEEILDWFKTLGFDSGTTATYYPLISNMTFYRNANAVPAANLVDGKPAFDGHLLEKLPVSGLNFLELLARAGNLDELRNNLLQGDKAPRTVLYLLIRQAILQELSRKAEVYYKAGNIVYNRGTFTKSLVNFSSDTPDLTSWELLRGRPSQLNLPGFTIDRPLGDHFLEVPDSHADASGIREIRAALDSLATLPTNRLERYLADHIDLCTYRLDAWETGLFDRRLKQQRATRPEGIYVGAYGWVENLTLDVPIPVDPGGLPEQLKPPAGKTLYKFPDNAGFVHTPSLNHASAAGLLLAGYHNHATKDNPGLLAVNLSSERVRRAQLAYQGIQNGQYLEALLGYQFERALHDATASDPVNRNLNQYILAFREKFPFQAQSIPQQGAQNVQETIPPTPVVNGLKLLEADHGAIVSLVVLPAHQPLVLKAVDGLRDTLDALNDLLVAESAYQVAQGNLDRTTAVLNAMRNAELPPDLEVVKTPRSSRLTFTNKVSLHFDPRMPFTAGGHWPADLSPRALMEKGLNHWLGGIIGDPLRTVCRVVAADEHGAEANPQQIPLNETDLQPIDLVYIMGADINAGATELESRVARAYRRRVNVAPEATIRINFNPAVNEPGMRTFAQVFPLIRTLRLLIAESRPANAQDFAPKKQQEPLEAPLRYGWDAEELKRRIADVLDKLRLEVLRIENQSSGATTPGFATLKAVFEQYFAAGKSTALLAQVGLNDQAKTQLTAFQRAAARFGLSLAFPNNVDVRAERTPAELLAKSAELWKQLRQKDQLTVAKLAEAQGQPDVNLRVRKLMEAGKALLGDEFVVIPQFRYTNPDDLDGSFSENGEQLLDYIAKLERTEPDLAMESWLQSTARVRPNMDRLERIRLIGEALDGNEINFVAVQTPYRIKDSWLPVEFPDIYSPTGKPFGISEDTLALAVHGGPARRTDQLQSALIIDEWTETIPTDEEVTGIAFHFDQPNAAPPNVLLLAVEPEGEAHWSWDSLLNILNDTLRRAKSRAVEPAHLLEDSVLGALVPMTVASFDLSGANVSLDYLTASDQFIAAVRQQNFELYNAWTTGD